MQRLSKFRTQRPSKLHTLNMEGLLEVNFTSITLLKTKMKTKRKQKTQRLGPNYEGFQTIKCILPMSQLVYLLPGEA